MPHLLVTYVYCIRYFILISYLRRTVHTINTSVTNLRCPIVPACGRQLFTVELQKVNNTLGLSLRRTDDTVLGHTIRAKVREPAISDPRVRVGDKLLQVSPVMWRQTWQNSSSQGQWFCIII